MNSRALFVALCANSQDCFRDKSVVVCSIYAPVTDGSLCDIPVAEFFMAARQITWQTTGLPVYFVAIRLLLNKVFNLKSIYRWI